MKTKCIPLTYTEDATSILRETPIDLVLADADQPASFDSVVAHRALHHPSLPILAMRDERNSDGSAISPDTPHIGKPLSLPRFIYADYRL